MKRPIFNHMLRFLSGMSAFLLAATLTGCDTTGTPEPQASVLQADVTAEAKPMVRTFVAPLDGGQEVATTPVETNATGNAVFQLSKDGMELHYKLIVANIENVTMAHIHLAPAGTNGGVVVWLYPASPPAQLIPGRSSGILATGVITAANLVNALADKPLSDLIDKMETGGAYVNVHTQQYPAGEIRGQIK